ncbi:MAG: hypothetical protein GY906_06740 [bacterium]|nr:hypothetical protein [bacterium]
MRVAVGAFLQLVLLSLPVGGTTLIEMHLSTVEQVRFVPLLPVYEPVPGSPELEAGLRSMAAAVLSDNGLEVTASKGNWPVLYLEVKLDRHEKTCSCLALIVSVSLIERGSLERRWQSGLEPQTVDFFSSVSSWHEDQVLLVSKEDLLAQIKESSQMLLEEFAGSVAQARMAASQ